MKKYLRPVFLAFLALVFTIGLTFATVELPYRIDGILIDSVRTPDLDTNSSDTSGIQAELFIDHYNLRELGYGAFALMVLLIIVGFASRKTAMAAVGAFAFMLPVFAQFAGVMFFLAGLGVLNVLWLPLLDISFGFQRLGMVIHAPYDLLMWVFRRAGINGYWYIVYFFIGSGLLVFFLGTFVWLAARAGRKKVADLRIYRFSRHPQYAGWILWSYGVYLLLLRALYPKRSWGISGSLPWLLSTLFIIGVAMVEEIRMTSRSGSEYESYRNRAPFLFPMPAFLRKFFSIPLRVFFKKDFPERIREVAFVLSVYGLALLCLSGLFYMGGSGAITLLFRSAEEQSREMEQIAERLDAETGRLARYRLSARLESYGEPATEYFIRLLDSGNPPVRHIAIGILERRSADEAVPHLIEMLNDPVPGIRSQAASALGSIGSKDAVGPLLEIAEGSAGDPPMNAIQSLARLGCEDIIGLIDPLLRSDKKWTRAQAIDALGILGSEKALPKVIEGLGDEYYYARRMAVVALLRIGSDMACPELKKATEDEDWEVRVYAAEALKRLCR